MRTSVLLSEDEEDTVVFGEGGRRQCLQLVHVESQHSREEDKFK